MLLLKIAVAGFSLGPVCGLCLLGLECGLGVLALQENLVESR